jgi:hypothetical protein
VLYSFLSASNTISKATPYTRRQRGQSRMCPAAATMRSMACLLSKSPDIPCNVCVFRTSALAHALRGQRHLSWLACAGTRSTQGRRLSRRAWQEWFAFNSSPPRRSCARCAPGSGPQDGDVALPVPCGAGLDDNSHYPLRSCSGGKSQFIVRGPGTLSETKPLGLSA